MPYLQLNDSQICSICNLEKRLGDYYIDKRKSKGELFYIGTRCRKCIAQKSIESRKRIYGSNAFARRYQRYKLAKNHLISLAEYYDHQCPICQCRPLQVVDHDHVTNKVRGMLCQVCNKALGAMGDSQDLVERLIVYFNNKDISQILSQSPELGESLDRTHSPGKQVLFDLYHGHGFSYADIAIKYNVSLGTVAYWFRKYTITPRSNSDGLKLAWRKEKFNAIS